VYKNENEKVDIPGENIDVIIENDVKNTSDVLEVVNIEYNENSPTDKENIKSTIEELFKSINGKSTENVLIDKIPSSYYEIAVGKNQNYYMPRFIIMESMKKKSLINFSAFIFPLAWSVYRKMYKLALIVFALYIALFSITIAPVLMNDELISSMNECLAEDPDFAEKVLMYNSGQNVTFTKTQAKFIELSENFKISPVITIGTLIISVGMKVFFGMNSTNLYMKKLRKKIKSVMELPVPEEEKKTILKVKTGVSPMFIAVIVGIIEYTVFGRF
ncbi:MAG: DUF2628 domain-containing protein, partial [Clostridia bacterium]|nr:DUF2628 domain-containing protein [Clostridia bacterium]